MKVLFVSGKEYENFSCISEEWNRAALETIGVMTARGDECRVLVSPEDSRETVFGVPVERGRTDRDGLLSLRGKYPFTGLVLASRDRAVESASRKLGIPCVAVSPAPAPLHVWALDSVWHDRRLQAIAREDDCIETWGEEDLLCLLPKSQRYYSRFDPLLGKYSELFYDPGRRMVLVPVSRAVDAVCRLKLGCGVRKWLLDLPRHRDVRYVVIPLDETGLFPSDGFWPREDVLRLGSNAFNHRLLSLIDKADAVLATDSVSSVLPLFMGRLCLADPRLASGVAKTLPSLKRWVTSWDTGGFSCLRPRLITFLLECGLVADKNVCMGALCGIWGEEHMMQLSSVEQWFSLAALSWTERRSQPTRRSRVFKKLCKLFRDPYMFCNDSQYKPLYAVRRLFA